MNKELEIKWERIRKFLRANRMDGLLLNRVSNFAWFTGGANNFVALHTDSGASSILITAKKLYLVANNIEAPRLETEELKKIPCGKIVLPWYKDDLLFEKVRKLAGGTIGCDRQVKGFVPVDIDDLHQPLVPQEIARYRKLGRDVSTTVSAICRKIIPGMTETEIAGLLSAKFWKQGYIPVVLLIAADKRICNFRHPIATEARVHNYVMIVVCVRGWGLILSMTRIVSFKKPPAQLAKKHEAVCTVDAAFIASTVSGNRVNDAFKAGIAAYRKTHFADEWKKHHQGGPTGYATRYYRATFSTHTEIEPQQAFAWNPSITGTKSEDTIITTDKEPVIISEDTKWPKKEIRANGKIVARPDILVR